VGHYGPVKHTGISLTCSKAYCIPLFFSEIAYNLAAMFLHSDISVTETIISVVVSTVLLPNYDSLVLISLRNSFQFLRGG